jgi:hypothetical protein
MREDLLKSVVKTLRRRGAADRQGHLIDWE